MSEPNFKGQMAIKIAGILTDALHHDGYLSADMGQYLFDEVSEVLMRAPDVTISSMLDTLIDRARRTELTQSILADEQITAEDEEGDSFYNDYTIDE